MEVPFKLIQKYYNLISNSQSKLITSLGQKKYRERTGLFVAEGPKVIDELLAEGLRMKWFFTTDASQISSSSHFLITEAVLKKISFLKSANTSIAVFELPDPTPYTDTGLVVALDALRDPANLGTIIRLCDWFGVGQLICSQDTADCHYPKMVHAS